jgi:hypothetical protein
MDQKVASPSGRSAASSLTATLDRLAPYALSILRIMAALLFLEHGTSKFFDFPQVMEPFPVFSMEWFAGLIEFAGGILVALGLFPLPCAARVLSHAQPRRCGDPVLLRLCLSGLRRRRTVEPRHAAVAAERARLKAGLFHELRSPLPAGVTHSGTKENFRQTGRLDGT